MSERKRERRSFLKTLIGGVAAVMAMSLEPVKKLLGAAIPIVPKPEYVRLLIPWGISLKE